VGMGKSGETVFETQGEYTQKLSDLDSIGGHHTQHHATQKRERASKLVTREKVWCLDEGGGGISWELSIEC